MPRKACDSTNEVRFTLGEVERRELKRINQEIEELIKSKKVANYAGAITWPVIGLAGAAGVGIAGYYIGQGLADFFPSLEWGEVREDGTRIGLKEFLTGKDEYTFKNADGTTRTYKNPFSGIPGLGQFWGIGVFLGEYMADTGFTGRPQNGTTVPQPQSKPGSGYNPTAETTGQGYTAAQYDAAYLCAKRYREGKIDFNEYLQCMEDAELMQGTR